MKHILLLTAISLVMALSNSAWADTGYVTVGTGTSSSSDYPYGTRDKYSTTQSIYTANEIGTGGTIRTIAYKVASSGSLSTTSVTIYMGHTSKSSFSSSSDYLNVSNMTLVYSGSPTLATQTGWEELTLSTPFAYNGTDNLVIVVGRQSNSYNVSAKYYYSTTSSDQCLSRSTDNSSSYGNPSTTGDYSTSTSRANVRLDIAPFKEVGEFCYSISSVTTATVCGTTATGEVSIPSSVTIDGINYEVTSISAGAFKNNTEITSITIPSSVTSIGSLAFHGCSSLASITIPASVTSIGYAAFENCSSLASITIPASVTSIGDYEFYGCSSLTSLSIPSSVTSIGYAAFYGCSGLTSLTIPSSVTSIGSYAVNRCSGLTSLTIPSSVTSIGIYAFYGCTGKLTVNCNIGSASNSEYGWFYGSKFSSVEISKDVTSIGNDAFTGCTSIKEVKIEDGTTVLSLGYKSNSSNSSYYYGLFMDCPIETLYLGRNLSYSTHSYNSSYPGYGAPFEYQSKMQSVTIGGNVTSIGSSAFYGCSGLTSITIPASVTSIGSSAFAKCIYEA